jgi:hypothetical protein
VTAARDKGHATAHDTAGTVRELPLVRNAHQQCRTCFSPCSQRKLMDSLVEANKWRSAFKEVAALVAGGHVSGAREPDIQVCGCFRGVCTLGRTPHIHKQRALTGHHLPTLTH